MGHGHPYRFRGPLKDRGDGVYTVASSPDSRSLAPPFAKPWYALRSMRVFRDVTTLSLTHERVRVHIETDKLALNGIGHHGRSERRSIAFLSPGVRARRPRRDSGPARRQTEQVAEAVDNGRGQLGLKDEYRFRCGSGPAVS